MKSLNMRQKYDGGHGIRIPGNQWLYQGIVYSVPSKGHVFRRATKPSGVTGLILKPTARQLRALLDNGTIRRAG